MRIRTRDATPLLLGLLACLAAPAAAQAPAAVRVGMIGLDTSHSVEFTRLLNGPDPGPELAEAYPEAVGAFR